ncbi:MAG: hypothetical protein PGN25_15115 [Methylorubrum populi]
MNRTFQYVDIDGRPWSVERLDALLSDGAVRLIVEQGARIGSHSAGNRWAPGALLAWAQKRYRRPEAAALLLLLVARFFDLGFEPDIDGGAA